MTGVTTAHWAEILPGWTGEEKDRGRALWTHPDGPDHGAAMTKPGGMITVLRPWGEFPAGGYSIHELRQLLGLAPPEQDPRQLAAPRRELAGEVTPPREPMYVDVAEILNGDHHAPKPTVGGRREDGEPLLYAAAVNILFGPPEAGKTLAAGAMTVHEIAAGGRVLWLDLDHNGAPAILTRLESLGMDRADLVNPGRFRLALPEDQDAVMDVMQDGVTWKPTLIIVDSIGELLPMFGASTNDSDDYTRVHRHVLAAAASRIGAAVLAIDHEAKNTESRNYGSTGAMAKKRAVDGVMLRVVNVAPFTPGLGGESQLAIVKDRHGALRGIAQGTREPVLARFILTGPAHALNVIFAKPVKPPTFDMLDDVEHLLRMTPPPTSIRDVKTRLRWGSDKATAAFRAYRERSGNTDGIPVPVFPTPIGGNAGTPLQEITTEPTTKEQP